MKTVFITIGEEIIFRNIFTEDFLSKLLSLGDVRLIFLVLKGKKDIISEAVKNDRVIFEEYKRAEFGIYDRFFNYLSRSGINSNTNLWSKMRSYERGDSSFISTYFKRILAFVFGGFDWYKKFVRFMLLKGKSDKNLKKIFDFYKPDVLFATSLSNFDFDVLVSREAKKRGIKVVGMIRSWDNFSSHGLLRVIPDVFLIQNDFLIDMAEKYQGIYRKNVPMKIIGLPHYDEVFNLKEVIEPREKFLSRLNLGPNEKYILYGAMGDFLFERESMDMPKIFDNLVEDGSLKVNKVVYRAHPKFRIESEQKLKNVHFDISGEYVRTAHSGISNNAYLINSIYHSEVLITGASTMAIDSAIIDKPVICVAFDGLAKDGEVSYYSSVKRFYDLYTHFEELVKTGGVKIAYSKEQMVDFVKKYEDDSSLDREGRMAIKDRFCYRIDGLSSKRLFEYLVEELKIS